MLILEIPFFLNFSTPFLSPFLSPFVCFIIISVFFSNFNWLDNYFAFVVTLIARVMMMYIYILHNCYATKHFNLNSIFNVTTFFFCTILPTPSAGVCPSLHAFICPSMFPKLLYVATIKCPIPESLIRCAKLKILFILIISSWDLKINQCC